MKQVTKKGGSNGFFECFYQVKGGAAYTAVNLQVQSDEQTTLF